MNYEYKVDGKDVTLDPDETMMGVRYTELTPHSARAELVGNLGAQYENRFELPNEKYTVVRFPGLSALSPRAANVAQADNRVARIAPVFTLGKTKVIATDRILVGLSNPDEAVEPLLADIDAVQIENRGYGEYTVHLAEHVDPLTTANQLANAPGVSYAEPDFVNIGSEAQANAPRDDPGLATQGRALFPLEQPAAVERLDIELTNERIAIKGCSHHITISRVADAREGSPVMDADSGFPLKRVREQLPLQYALAITMADKAFGLQAGSANVRIAVLDEGVDTRHPDLRPSIVGGFDVVDGDEFQEPNAWDGHGTACAGLAAAVPSVPHGMRGIGGGCSILAVRIAYSRQPGGPWFTTSSGIARGVEWSWRKGADILSNSWGGGAPSNAIVRAFHRARTQGRRGKGCVLVVAAGNDAGPVSFPATIKGVLSVSASNEYDEFKTKTSRDGEDWWGSNFGPEVSIAAPGVHNYTTDITGTAGYSNSNYYATFNGTSSATPLVAGACALVLSANPSLTELEIRRILERSADKIGNVPYINGRNDQMGFGRLNVHSAICAVLNS